MGLRGQHSRSTRELGRVSHPHSGKAIIYRSAWNIRKTNFRVHFLFFDFGAFDADTWSALAPVWPHRDVSDTALPNHTTHVGWRCGSGCIASASSRQNRGAERSAQGAETSARRSNKRAEEPGWAHWCICADMCVFYFLGFCPASWQGLWRHWPIYSEFPSSLQTAELACHACSTAKETPKVAQSSREAGLWRPEVATCPACCDRRTSWMSLLHWCIFFFFCRFLKWFIWSHPHFSARDWRSSWWLSSCDFL